MSVGHWLTDADIEDVSKLITYFVNQNAILGTLEKLTIQNYNWDNDDKCEFSVHINTTRAVDAYGTFSTGDNAVGIFDNIDERDNYSAKLLELLKKTQIKIETKPVRYFSKDHLIVP